MAKMLLGAVILILNSYSVFCRFLVRPPLLLISFDGFRWDYLTRTHTPNFDTFLKNGVTARRGIKNVFVTNTLPNHWSLVTGLYSESHGVLDNHMVDPDIDQPFVPQYIDAAYFNDLRYYDDGGEPIWVTNQLQKQGRSGSVMWWGSENPVKGVLPTFQMPYNDNVSSWDRIDTVVKWFTSEFHINLGLVYFPEPDHTAHRTGPESANVTEQIGNADKIVGYLLEKLKENDLLDDLNIIITSDHGFATVSRDKLIPLDMFVSRADYTMITYSPVASIFPHEGKFDEVYLRLAFAAAQPGSHFQVYKADEIPERFHYKHHPKRVPPIIAISELGHSFIRDISIGTNFKLEFHLRVSPGDLTPVLKFCSEAYIRRAYTVIYLLKQNRILAVEAGVLYILQAAWFQRSQIRLVWEIDITNNPLSQFSQKTVMNKNVQ